MSALAYALSQTLVAPALPAIQQELNTSTTTVTYVLTAYLLSASVATPIMGRFGDMFGKERMLVVTLIAFGLGSLIAAVSHSIELLILGRVIQGIGGAVFPLAFGIIRDEFPPERVATGIGLISATFGIGGGLGLVLSGVIVDNLSYEWLFWLGVGVTAVAVVATHLFVPESPVKSPAKIDWIGAGLLSAALVALLVGVSEGNNWGWGSAPVIGLFAAAVVLAVVWVRFELRVPQPLVDIAMMRKRAVLTTNLAGLLVGFGMFGSFILIPQLVQTPESTGYGFGASGHPGRPVPAALGADHARRRPAGGLARIAFRLEAADAARHRDRLLQLPLPRAGARRALDRSTSAPRSWAWASASRSPRWPT